MTITKYTFFSPNGNDYPVTANADAKMYTMLSGIDYTTFKRKNWSPTTSTGLTRTYVNTSFIVAGRYFELINHMITLPASSTSYIHVNIDLSTPLDPVSITVNASDVSNTIDINNGSGVYRRCFETITTNASGISSSQSVPQINVMDNITTGNITALSGNLTNVIVSNKLDAVNLGVTGGVTTYNATIKNNLQTKTMTSTGAASVGSALNVSGKATVGSLEVNGSSKVNGNSTTTGTHKAKNLIIQPDITAEDWAFQTPTFYDTLTGTSTSLGYLTLFKSGNTVTGQFNGDPTPGAIPGAGAIVGWITQNSFKPENTVYFTVFGANGERWRFTIDSGGALRSHSPLAKGVTIWDTITFAVRGTDSGVR